MPENLRLKISNLWILSSPGVAPVSTRAQPPTYALVLVVFWRVWVRPDRSGPSPTPKQRGMSDGVSRVAIETLASGPRVLTLGFRPMSDLTIEPITQPFSVSLSPPGSKSLTNRALVLAALADGTLRRCRNVLFADDTLVMLECLRKLGFHLEIDRRRPHRPRARPRRAGSTARDAELFCGNSGTTIRFLTALCSLGQGPLHPRRHRAHAPAADRRSSSEMLRNLGVRDRVPRWTTASRRCACIADGLPGGIVRFGASAVVAVPLGGAAWSRRTRGTRCRSTSTGRRRAGRTSR